MKVKDDPLRKRTTNNEPHQGSQEKARRLRHIEKKRQYIVGQTEKGI